jgi:DNA-binding transcriptional LysR family regulator
MLIINVVNIYSDMHVQPVTGFQSAQTITAKVVNMNFSAIETFLAIVQTRNMTRAAEKLFLSQSTVSHQLKALEQEVGAILVDRQKGYRTIELTPKGQEFVQIAERWIALWKETQSLQSTTSPISLSVGGPNNLLTHGLPSFFKKIIADYKPINLRIMSYHSDRIYSALENREIDVGLAFYQTHFKNVVTQELFREPMRLLCPSNSDIRSPVNPLDLNPDDEIYVYWCPEYQRWHETWWESKGRSKTETDTASLVLTLMDLSRQWMIAPLSIALSLRSASNEALDIYELANPPPDRICYKMLHKYPKPSSAPGIEIFSREIIDFCNNLPWADLNK